MPTINTARSFLFVPGNDERKLRRALSAGADAVVTDLEDAVTPDEKEAARALTARVLAEAEGDALRLVRVNAAGSEWIAEDVDTVGSLGLDGVVLPKAEAAAVRGVGDLDLPVVAIVETAAGLRGAFELASLPAVEALVLGAVDLGVALGLEPREDGLEVLFARSSLVVDSAAAGLRGPIDQVWTTLRDDAGLRRDCELARSLGFRGKACIHPEQISVVNDAFSPSSAELARARDVVRAFENAAANGRGAVALDGEMIDLPVAQRARDLLAEAKRSVLYGD
ncbi:MAG TPA: CoA ester lyase [Gaiellaceae bacterium]|nr:CoA ester lyase [Gaiellaceae bacterium]